MATPDGEQPISTLKVGDLVLAYDVATQTTAAYTVTATIHHTDTVVLDLVVGDEYLETTPEHPFFTAMRGWVDAQDLQEGDLVRQADGDYGAVQAVGVALRAQPMYNLTVATAHTFFVGHGQWLVHNANCPIPRLIGSGPEVARMQALVEREHANILQRVTGVPNYKIPHMVSVGRNIETGEEFFARSFSYDPVAEVIAMNQLRTAPGFPYTYWTECSEARLCYMQTRYIQANNQMVAVEHGAGGVDLGKIELYTWEFKKGIYRVPCTQRCQKSVVPYVYRIYQ